MNIFSRAENFQRSRPGPEPGQVRDPLASQQYLPDPPAEEIIKPTRYQRIVHRLAEATSVFKSSVQNRVALAAVVIVASFTLTALYFYVIPAVAVAYTVQPTPVTVQISGPGILDALRKVTITSRSAGFLRKIHVDNNDRVKQGDLIAELDSVDLAGQLAAARAEAEAAKYAVEQARRDYDIALATDAKTKADLQRRQPLRDRGVISSAEFDNAKMANQQAEATLARSKVAIQRASAQAAAAVAQVEVLGSRLNDTRLQSPMDAIVISRDRSPGDLLAPGTTLVRLVDPSSVVISARLDESVMSVIQPGQDAFLEFTSSPRTPIEGKVLRVGRSVDVETREFVIDVVPKQLPPNWAIGQRSKVRISAKLANGTISVPQNMIARRYGQVAVWKLSSTGSVHWTRVELGIFAGSYVEILSGLKVGDTVVSPVGRYEYERIWAKSATP
jgi:HlyD family secretion protein